MTLESAYAEIARLRAELAVRTHYPGFPSVPAQFRNGARAAYDSGYEMGWLNRQYRDPYTSPRHGRAYNAGYRAGEAESLEEIGRMICPTGGGRRAKVIHDPRTPYFPRAEHGKDCPKIDHGTRTGHLHAADDDSPFDVDHVWYCGRCHMCLAGSRSNL